MIPCKAMLRSPIFVFLGLAEEVLELVDGTSEAGKTDPGPTDTFVG